MLYVCIDPADDLVLGGVYELAGPAAGRLFVRALHAPRVSLLLTHLAARFRAVGSFSAEAFCLCCGGGGEVRTCWFDADGLPVAPAGVKPCPGCGGSGVSVRAAGFRGDAGALL